MATKYHVPVLQMFIIFISFIYFNLLQSADKIYNHIAQWSNNSFVKNIKSEFFIEINEHFQNQACIKLQDSMYCLKVISKALFY